MIGNNMSRDEPAENITIIFLLALTKHESKVNCLFKHCQLTDRVDMLLSTVETTCVNTSFLTL